MFFTQTNLLFVENIWTQPLALLPNSWKETDSAEQPHTGAASMGRRDPLPWGTAKPTLYTLFLGEKVSVWQVKRSAVAKRPSPGLSGLQVLPTTAPGVRQGPASPIRLGLAATCTLHVGTVESVGAGTCPGVPRSLQQVRTPLITVSYGDADEHTDRLGLLTELLLALKVKPNNNPSCSPWQERDAWLRAPTHGQAAGLDEQPRWWDALHCFQPG